MAFLIENANIKGIHDTIINAFDAGLQNKKISYPAPERAAEERTKALRVNEIVNAISDFVVGTNMSAMITEYDPGYNSCVEIHDTPDYNDEWFGLKIVFELSRWRDGVDILVFVDRIVGKHSGTRCGYSADFHKHTKTIFKQFGAEKLSNNEYFINREAFVKSIPQMIKYFNKSNTLFRNRENNAKIINEIKQGLRKKEVKAIQFNTIAALAEEWVKGIDPNLHIAVQDISPIGGTDYSKWRINIINSLPVIWYTNRHYNNDFHNLVTRPLDSHTLLDKRYILPELTRGQRMYREVKEYATKQIENNDFLTSEQRKEYLEEANREPAKIGKLYTCDPRFNSKIDNFTDVADISFTVMLNYKNNYWNVKYSRKEQLPERFRQLLDFGCTTEIENFEYVVEYMAQCIHVEEMLWKKADEQWFDLANILKEDQITRKFLVTRNTYCANGGLDVKYPGTADPDTVMDNVNNLAAQGFYVE